MYLVDWVQANGLVIFTLLIIFGIPLVVALIVFGKNKKDDASPE